MNKGSDSPNPLDNERLKSLVHAHMSRNNRTAANSDKVVEFEVAPVPAETDTLRQCSTLKIAEEIRKFQIESRKPAIHQSCTVQERGLRSFHSRRNGA